MEATPVPELNFTAIDVETANSSRASVCAVGLAKVRGGEVTETASWLVKPPPGHDEFAPVNVAIHGITPGDVANAPGWDAVFPQIAHFADGDDLVAHNAPFDRSVLRSACTAYDIDWPEMLWYDTLTIARAELMLGSYQLPFVARALGLEELPHHEAGADALQAARVALALAGRCGAATLEDLAPGARPGIAADGGAFRSTGDFSSLSSSVVLAGEMVVFTGALQRSTRSEAQALVEHFGGTPQSGVTRKTTMVVTGDFNPATLRPGATMSSKLTKAMRLAEQGQRIEIWTEDDFYQHLELGEDEIESAIRAQRVARSTSSLPDYVLRQARHIEVPTSNYYYWLRQVLIHPDGRAAAGDQCIRCDGEIPEGLDWKLSERHVCSKDCNERLKEAAKRFVRREGISHPEPPDYTGWKRRYSDGE
ncbi:exonuclease domain-containing protein [Brachybacterium sp. UMB0905]|uniref:exonuclease domain-containing protein n=1 Tax=Brachybacterium sp. UMB0905 TaxID=2069310 RepID=UPI000C8016D2|nr:exonuclease domain-containing protein [Brachybacterium sp. UMB0905]PMC74923.1 hypothetical protein CJ197_10550 [Brachybacterium sp. UMB0905]